MKKSFFLTLLFCLLTTVGAQALEYYHGYISDWHDRFVVGTFPGAPVPNPTFFLAGYENQLAGVGWQTGYEVKKVALISPQHFINANHFKAVGSVTFCNQDGQLKTYEIDTNTTIRKTDLAIGRLKNPIPPEDKIPFYSTYTVDYNKLVRKVVPCIGRGSGNTRFAAGVRITGDALYNSGSYGWLYSVSGEEWKADEIGMPEEDRVDLCYAETLDSGSPSFLIHNGKLLLLGHHNATPYDQFLGAYRDNVNQLLGRDGYSLHVYDEENLEYPLTITVNPTGSGATEPSATTSYPEGTVVNLTATPSTGYLFSGWSGDLTDISPTTQITMDSGKTVTANFIDALSPYTLTITVNPTGSGTTEPSATTSYPEGTVVNITANPTDGYIFNSWSGGVANPVSASTTVTMDSSKTVTAQFTLDHSLSVTPSNVTVSSSAGTTNFAVSNLGSGTMNWNAAVISGANWISIMQGASGTNDGTITISFTRNTNRANRIGVIRVTAPGSTSPGYADITVTQLKK